MGVLKHFGPWIIFWPGGIETFRPKIYEDFELYQVFILNFFKYFETF